MQVDFLRDPVFWFMVFPALWTAVSVPTAVIALVWAFVT